MESEKCLTSLAPRADVVGAWLRFPHESRPLPLTSLCLASLHLACTCDFLQRTVLELLETLCPCVQRVGSVWELMTPTQPYEASGP